MSKVSFTWICDESGILEEREASGAMTAPLSVGGEVILKTQPNVEITFGKLLELSGSPELVIIRTEEGVFTIEPLDVGSWCLLSSTMKHKRVGPSTKAAHQRLMSAISEQKNLVAEARRGEFRVLKGGLC